jgi:Fe-S-cluster containining protein
MLVPRERDIRSARVTGKGISKEGLTMKVLEVAEGLFSSLDEVHETNLKTSAITVSCKKGCSHCCRLFTVIHAVEGAALANAVWRGKANWITTVERAAVAARKVVEVSDDRIAYFQAQIPCPLLDLKKNECRTYAERPAACRLYAVKSDPSLCAVSDVPTKVAMLNTLAMQGEFLNLCISLTHSVEVAPLPIVLLFGMATLAPTKRKRSSILSLVKGLPTPNEWAQEHAEKYSSKWFQELDEEERRVHIEAAKSVYGKEAVESFHSKRAGELGELKHSGSEEILVKASS